ncbi:MAG: class I SAM-dependent methyltransferase, partial [Chloroflexi bacterium]|nr:class I SAM-dependent methyltransferase [Chloroflexota bacterium]
MVDFSRIKQYFADRLDKYGATPQGLDWNSIESQHIRYEQLVKVIDGKESYTLLDYGCGFGSFYDFLKSKDHHFSYIGFDIVETMVEKGKQLHLGNSQCTFTSYKSELHTVDYVVESGIFNMKQNDRYEDWTQYVLNSLTEMNKFAKKGMAANFLTKYSDPEYMRPDLYYADPC